MRLLFISHCYPWPLKSGTAQRVFHLVEGFVARHHVTLVTLHRFRDAPQQDFPLRERVRLIEVSDPEVQRKLTDCGRSEHARVLFSSPLPLVATQWYSPELLRVLRDLQRSETFDVVWAERFSMAEIAREAGFERLVVDLDDLETLVQLQHVRRSGLFPPRLLAYAELAKLFVYERSLPQRFWRLVVCKEKDRRFFGRWNTRVFVVPNGTAAVAAAPSAREKDGELSFIGSLSYGPNADAAIHFHNDVLPEIIRNYPRARFVIVGMHPPSYVSALHDGQACSVVGAVPDVTPYYETASVVVVPLRVGAGTKLKVLEALAHGKAVVSTSIGVEGLDLRPGVDVEVADDPKTFARACVHLLQNSAARHRLGESGRQRVISQYAWERAAASAERAILS